MVYSVGVAQSDRERGPFGTLIRETRKAADLTHEDIYRETGVSRSTLSRWENGHTDKPDPDELAKVLRFIGLPRQDAYQALGWISVDDSVIGISSSEPTVAGRDASGQAHGYTGYGAEVFKALEPLVRKGLMTEDDRRFVIQAAEGQHARRSVG